VIPVAVRRWRRALASAGTWAEIRAVRARLREARYDLALDLQGLVKSAWIARWTRAPVAGFDRASVREPLAALAYAKSYAVSRELHAIERLRSLAAQALGYSLRGGPRFALAPPPLELPWRPRAPYAVLLHATSRAEKLWPAERWVELGARLLHAGVSVVLPWGGEPERESAQRLAHAIGAARDAGPDRAPDRGPDLESDRVPCALVPPRTSLRECARLLADARAVVGVDTGLTHLAAALERPTVALFAATAAWRYGPYWTPRATSLGADGVWPQAVEVLAALEELGALSR
jgi:heptosyltransferase-1